MKHNKWINYIHLLGSDELELREQQALNEHLKVCSGCRAVYEQLRLDWAGVIGEMTMSPHIPNPEALTASILTRIENMDTQSFKHQQLRVAKGFQLVFHPDIRLGLQLATLVLLAIFLVEQYEVTQSVKSLEIQMHKQSDQAHVVILPDRIKKRLLVNLKQQLDKHSLSSKRIERVINRLEITAQPADFWHLESGAIEGDSELSIFERMKDNWRRP